MQYEEGKRESGLPERIPVLVNGHAGADRNDGDIEKRLRQAFAAQGCEAQCRLLSPGDMGKTLRKFVRQGEALACVPFVFVGNNRYAERPLGLASRQRLDAGKLHLAYPRGPDHKAVLRLLLGALLRPLSQSPNPVNRDVQNLRLHARRRRLTVALDGELQRLAQQLRFRVRKVALRVLMPASDDVTRQIGSNA